MLRATQDAVTIILIRKDIEETILANIKRRFTNLKFQRDPDTGKAWAPLKKNTRARRKVSKSRPHKLVDTGSLLDALFIQRAGLRDALVRGIGTSTVSIRSRVSRSSPKFNVRDIARKHQLGEGRIPARPFLGVSKREGKEIENLFDVSIAKAVGRVPGVRGTP